MRTYTAPELRRAAGITKRQVEHWHAVGLLPERRTRRGSGYPHAWTEVDVIVACAVARFAEARGIDKSTNRRLATLRQLAVVVRRAVEDGTLADRVVVAAGSAAAVLDWEDLGGWLDETETYTAAAGSYLLDTAMVAA